MADQTPAALEAQKVARAEFAALLRSGKYTHRIGPQIADLPNCRLCAVMAWAHNRGLIPREHAARVYDAFEKETGIRADQVWRINDFPNPDMEEGDPAIFEEIAGYVEAFAPRTQV